MATHGGEVFDGDVLDKDLERIRRFYRAQGYYEARIRAARVVRVGPQKVRVEIEAMPGAPVVVSTLDLVGFDVLPNRLAREIRDAPELHVGDPFVEDRFHAGARDIERALADEGYAFAKVAERADVSVLQKKARVEYRLTLGQKAVFGDIRIDGLGALDADVVRSKLGVKKGDPYSKRNLQAARRRLFGLGVFSIVEIRPNLQNPESAEIPVQVVLAVGTTHSVHFGAVVEEDTVRGLAGLRIGWEGRNVFGGMRRLAADATPALIFYPLSNPDVGLKVLAAVMSSVRLEQPTIIDNLTTGFVQANLNVYPVLYSDFSPGDNIIGFKEVRGALGAERPLVEETLRVRASYNAQVSFPFMYLGDKPEGLDTLVVLFPELVGEVDLRDDAVDPRKGAYFKLSAELAGFVAGDANDLRLQPEVRLYAKLGASSSLAFRGELGLLFPKLCHGHPSRGCYGDSLTNAPNAPATDPAIVRDQQILLFRGFYSGGSSSNRGYNLREVGPHGTLGFLVPSNVNCAVPEPPDSCIRPLGGLTLWEQSVELRLVLSDFAGVVFFLDASDVTRQTFSFRLNFPHLAAGTGFRLRTPVGAARLDVGLRVPYMQEVGERKLPPEEGDPGTFLGAPIAVHFGLGEAF